MGKRTLWKRTVVCVAALGLCGGILLMPTGTVKTAWAEETTVSGSAIEQTEDTSGQGETTEQSTATENAENQDITGQEEATEDTTGQEDAVELEEQPVEKKTQKITVKTSKQVYTSDQFKTGKQKFKIGASAKTALSYKVASGKKYVSVNQNGLVTVSRWTPKGTYKITVTAKATDKYESATKTISESS